MRLIPAIDLKDGHCVRLLQGDFAAETRYDTDPRALLAKYRDFGADWLHIVDLDGARDGNLKNRTIIADLAAETSLKLQVGGGLRSAGVLADMLRLGVARVVVGSAAVGKADEVRQWLRDFGPDRITIAFDVRLDARGTPCVATHGWTQQSSLSLWEAASSYANSGLRHILCTDVSRDGALTGPNIELYAAAVRRFPNIAWQASGGVRDALDLAALAACGVSATISGKALLEDRIALEELRPFLPNA
jgi:phosphoribosylformimino-5-aminoimidazole carboxamide ribotide isomerase